MVYKLRGENKNTKKYKRNVERIRRLDKKIEKAKKMCIDERIKLIEKKRKVEAVKEKRREYYAKKKLVQGGIK